MGLRDLSTGDSATVEGVQSFSFSPDGAYLLMRRYAAAGAGPSRGGDDEDEVGPGRTILVRELASGRDMTFGNVAEFSWMDRDDSHLLAMVISATGNVGNGVHLYDAATSELRVLDSSESDYQDLTWRSDTGDLAVFRGKTLEGKEDFTQEILVWRGLPVTGDLLAYDPTADSSFPDGKRVVPFRSLAWSHSGDALFFGIAEWVDLALGKEHEAGEGEEAGADDGASAGPPGEDPEDPSTVEIWHWTDQYVMPWQKAHAAQDRERNLLSVWHIDDDRFVQLGGDYIDERITQIPYTDAAVVAEWSAYALERSIGRPGADVYLADINTGERSLLLEAINDRYLQVSPGGRYLTYMADGHFWSVDVESGAVTNITESAPVSFIDWESDQTSKVYPDELQKPPFGSAGWTTDDESILLYDDYDLWAVALDGSGAERLTLGAEEEVRHRLVRLDREFRFGPQATGAREDEWIDLDGPVHFSVYGEWTKRSGYAVRRGNGDVERLVWMDKNVGSLAKAEDAEVFGYVVQAYDDSPDLFVGGPGLTGAGQITATNAFQEEFAWGRSEVIEYTTDRGRRLQASLIYPAGYDPSKTYPMIVYNYELLSQNVHRYVAPSDRSYYNTAVFMTQGYFVLQPDIVFRPRQPGRSVVESVTAAVAKVVDMGLVDPERVGIIGHSMGGFNTSFVATHSHGVFAAAVAGAPMTDLVSYYGDHHWGNGVAETDHIETGQERMEVALYEDLQAYIDNSAVFGAHEMTVPLLIEVGDQDGIVAWYQGIELYNIARRAKKNVVLLGYIGEDHGLRQEANQKDYQRRILAWFGHYLKGEPAESWITEGKSFLAREAELKRMESKR
jgi:dipeptidyl aminopeptidase/acylaminoacyl peptidase